MGADLQEAKRVCKEDGKLFGDWCGSIGISYKTAQRLMAVNTELGQEKGHTGLLHHGFTVLAEITQTRDEDIEQQAEESIPGKLFDQKRKLTSFSIIASMCGISMEDHW